MSEERYPAETLGEDEDDGTMPANVASLADEVVGHRIVSVAEGVKLPERRWGMDTGTEIRLDNGKRVFLVDSWDCCACTALRKFLLHVDRVDHIITGVGTTDGFTKWHIYADMGDVLELTVDWSPGNPYYYGYGFDIVVHEPSEEVAK